MGVEVAEPASETRLRRWLLAVFLVGYLLCLPLWHETSRVKRETLPDMQADTETIIHTLPLVVQVLSVRHTDAAGSTVSQWGHELASHLRSQIDLQHTLVHSAAQINWTVQSLPHARFSIPSADLDDALLVQSSASTPPETAAGSLPAWHLFVLVESDEKSTSTHPLPDKLRAGWIMGKHRHAFTSISASSTLQQRQERIQHAAVLLHSLVQSQWCAALPTSHAAASSASSESDAPATELGVCAASRSLSHRLSFTLMNDEGDSAADVPEQQEWSWDFRSIEQAYLLPLTRRLAPFVSFTTDSSVVHYAQLTDSKPKSKSTSSKNTAATAAAVGQLPQPLREHVQSRLDAQEATAAASSDTAASSVSPAAAAAFSSSYSVLSAPSALRDLVGRVGGWNVASPLVHSSLEMLAYIPPVSRRPLAFSFNAPHKGSELTASGSNDKRSNRKPAKIHTSALFVPRYGGVAVLNDLPSHGCGDGDRNVSTAEGPCMLPLPVAQRLMQVFVAQLRGTLGLTLDVQQLCPRCGGSSSSSPATTRLLASPRFGVSVWEADLLGWRLVRANLADSAALLRALAELLQAVPHMPVSVEIRALVEEALAQSELARTHLAAAQPRWVEAGLASQASVAAAARAFFHPRLLPVLYFPDEHLYAVYLPLFLPVTVPLLVALASLFAAWNKERKQTRALAKASEKENAAQEQTIKTSDAKNDGAVPLAPVTADGASS